MSHRVVIDTNVYVSRALRGASVPGRAVDKAWSQGVTLLSVATWAELQVVLKRPKFAPYLDPQTVEQFLAKVKEIAAFILTGSPIRACRDPRDDKFLEVAVHGRADAIVTGDSDLQALHPFRGIEILRPADYLARK
jgi:putative PIN family toxin of toxin-antitoxin system